MIVVDTNIIAYLYLPGDYTQLAEELLLQKPEWVVPALWRSELRNVLTHYLRKNILTFDQIYAIQTEAEALLASKEYEIDSYSVLRQVQESSCSAYDCEFVVLAKRLNTKLITMDKKVLSAFPEIAVSLSAAIV
jgi:predicted nucleic acid-binding protein